MLSINWSRISIPSLASPSANSRLPSDSASFIKRSLLSLAISSKPLKSQLLNQLRVAFDFLAPMEYQRQQAEKFGAAAVVFGLVVGDAVGFGYDVQRATGNEHFGAAAHALVAAEVGKRRDLDGFAAPGFDHGLEGGLADLLFQPVARRRLFRDVERLTTAGAAEQQRVGKADDGAEVF